MDFELIELLRLNSEDGESLAVIQWGQEYFMATGDLSGIIERQQVLSFRLAGRIRRFRPEPLQPGEYVHLASRLQQDIGNDTTDLSPGKLFRLRPLPGKS